MPRPPRADERVKLLLFAAPGGAEYGVEFTATVTSPDGSRSRQVKGRGADERDALVRAFERISKLLTSADAI